MDTSEQYVKMCEGAEEIQKKWKANHGDVYINKDWTKGILLVGLKPDIDETLNPSLDTWLPRQDQLQEMVMPCINSEMITYYLSSVKRFNEPNRQFKSMEQLWLAFVMKEKFNKSWDGNKWA